MNLKRFWLTYRTPIGFAILTVGVLIAIALSTHQNNLANERIQLEAQIRAHSNCEGVNELRRDIITFLTHLAQPWPELPDDMDPATREWLEGVREAQQNGQTLSDQGVSFFQELECPKPPEEELMF